jgi:hypothetical protein
MNWRNYIPEIFKSRYTGALEVEVSRLRNENRALINSILGIAGLPPLRLEAEVARENHRAGIEARARNYGAPAVEHGTRGIGHDRAGTSKAVETSSIEAGVSESSSALSSGQGIMLPANPHRRRSWQQINRILEMEETRQIINRDNSDAMKPRSPEL